MAHSSVEWSRERSLCRRSSRLQPTEVASTTANPSVASEDQSDRPDTDNNHKFNSSSCRSAPTAPSKKSASVKRRRPTDPSADSAAVAQSNPSSQCSSAASGSAVTGSGSGSSELPSRARKRQRSAPPGGKRRRICKQRDLSSSSSPEPIARRTRSQTRTEDSSASLQPSSATEGNNPRQDLRRGAVRGRAGRGVIVPRGKAPGSTLGNTTGTCASARSRRVSARSVTDRRASSQPTAGLLPGMSDSEQRPPERGAEEAGPSQPLPPLPPDAQGASGGPPQVSGAGALPPPEFLFPPFMDEDGEMDSTNLQALLETRGLPPHIMGALGSRVQHFLHKAMPGASKVHQLLEGLQSSDEGSQLSACMELGSLLVMGNEDTLAGFPLKQCVGPLTRLVDSSNPEISLSACRALYNMLDTFPRSSSLLLESVPVLVNKLKDICIMDVAEQAMKVLEMISRRHPKVVLQADAVQYALSYLDFMSLTAQRSALQLTAHCCQAVQSDSFGHVSNSLRTLVDRLAGPDKRCVESVVQCFSCLVAALSAEPRLLKQLAAPGLLEAYKNLYQTQFQLMSSSLFVTSLRTVAAMCDKCPDLAAVLLKANMADTVCFLLVGQNGSASQTVQLVSRSGEELLCLVVLISTLLPPLPSSGVFAIDSVIRHNRLTHELPVVWQWKDDSGSWRNYSTQDCRILELAREARQEEVSLALNSRSYVIDLRAMSQQSEETGRRRQVQRREPATPPPLPPRDGSKTAVELVDPRLEVLREQTELAENFVNTLFPVLFRVYSSSAGPGVRHRCLQAMLKMIYFSEASLLESVLRDHSISSHIAGMLGASDYKLVVCALQMADVLLTKLPQVFSVYFLREGVLHEMEKLRERSAPEGSSPATLHPPSPGPPTSFSPLNPLATPLARPLEASSPSEGESAVTSRGLVPWGSGLPPQKAFLSTERLEQGSSAELRTSSARTSSDPVLMGAVGGSPPSFHTPTPALSANSEAVPLAASVDEQDTGRSSRFFGDSKRKKSGGRKATRKTSRDDPSELMPALRKGKSREGSSGTSRAHGMTSKAAALLASLHPRSWAKHSSANSTPKSTSSTPGAGNRSNLAEAAASKAALKEKLHSWCQQQATLFLRQCAAVSASSSAASPSLLERASAAVQALHQQRARPVAALREVSEMLSDCDISPFELLHSGLVNELTQLLAAPDLSLPDKRRRAAAFAHVFLGTPEPGLNGSCEQHTAAVQLQPQPLLTLLNRLHACTEQLEQFQVKVTEVPGTVGANRQGGSSALKFFHSHQIKCQLQRHPGCRSLREWRAGPVKIEPLALLSAVERYLVVRGYARPRGPDADVSDDSHSDDDLEDPMSAMQLISGHSKQRLEFLVGEHLVPHNMTIYQAVRQYGTETGGEASDETDTESVVGGHNIWIRTHTLWYRPASEESQKEVTPKRPKAEARSSRGRKDELWHDGQVPRVESHLERYLCPRLSEQLTVHDQSLPVLTLLHVLYGVAQHWTELYPNLAFTVDHRAAVPRSAFLSSKLTSKALRQLQDPLIIMTGNLPLWLKQLPAACPFLLSFEVRQLLFYLTAFDRDRVMMRLNEAHADPSGSSETSERVMPRQEMKKRHTVSRSNLLQQAEKIMEESASSRAFIEIQFENEEGTGLGPTLEFYALTSRELQRADLELWRGERTSAMHPYDKEMIDYVFAPYGMFPAPLPKTVKPAHLTKVKAKFRFLGKFLAKAVMDGRLVDVSLSGALGSWLLGEEHGLGGAGDLLQAGLEPVLVNSLQQLQQLAAHRHALLRQSASTGSEDAGVADPIKIESELQQLRENVDDLCLNFVLPGPGQIELQKGGKDMAVTLENVDDYLKLVQHWLLVRGVWRQLDALRDGFESVFPLSTLKLFYPSELEQLFCGAASNNDLWEARVIAEAARCDHGYTSYSPVVEWLYALLAVYTPHQRRQFVQFVTGAPNLPVGGFKALNPPLTIVRKTLDASQDPDSFLPSVMTCRNYLKLPEYSCYEVLERQMQQAISEGKLSFHLS